MTPPMRRPPFKFSARTRVGFSDTDAQGIVYYGRYNPYFDLARVEYLRMLGLLQRRGQARVSRLGRTSVTFTFAAYRLPDDVLMVTAHQTLVYVDLAERKAYRVPDAFREPVLAFEGSDVDA